MATRKQSMEMARDEAIEQIKLCTEILQLGYARLAYLERSPESVAINIAEITELSLSMETHEALIKSYEKTLKRVYRSKSVLMKDVVVNDGVIIKADGTIIQKGGNK